VCITAAYLKTFFREKVKKIAIVDFDVHHGNGTEQIIECLKQKMFTHNFYSPYFGKGMLKNIVYKPWCNEDDFKNIFFVSSH
jgi:acetoin utilization deacetylase AcuC-like enzyme